MKKCKKCGWENPNNINVCEQCYNILGKEINEEAGEKFFKKLDKKEKIINILNYALLSIYLIIVIPLFYISAKEIGSVGTNVILFILLIVVIPIVFYMSIFHPDILFEISYMNVISNIRDAQPSDWFYITTNWTAYLILACGIFITLRIYFGVI